jgi:hypothetical protein
MYENGLENIPWDVLLQIAQFLYTEDKEKMDEASEDAELTSMQADWESNGLKPEEVEDYAEYLVETN